MTAALYSPRSPAGWKDMSQVVMAVRLLHPWRAEEEWEKIGSPDIQLIASLVSDLPDFVDEDWEKLERQLKMLEEKLGELGFQVFRIGDYVFARVNSNTIVFVTYMYDEVDDKFSPVLGIVYLPIPLPLQRRVIEENLHLFPDDYDPCYEVVVYQNGEFEYRRVEG